MSDTLTLRPGPALHGRLRVPGDKSITHRAYLFGALARGVTEVENPNPGEDCAGTLACLRRLGVSTQALPDGVANSRWRAPLGSRKPPGSRTRRLKSSKPGTTRAIASRTRS